MLSLLEARNTVQWLPSESALPMRSVQRGSKVGGLFFLVLGTVLALGGAVFLITDTTHSLHASVLSAVIVVVMTGLFVVFGALFAWVGLHLLVAKTAITIRDDEVAVERTTVLGHVRWREPLDRYLGVSRSFSHLTGHTGAGGGSSHSRTYYEIHLKHPDPAKDVLLFQTSGLGSRELWGRAWRRLAATLSLPVLEETAEGPQPVGPPRRDPQPQAAAPPLGRRLIASQTPGGLQVSHAHYWGSWRGAMILALAIGFFATLRSLEPGSGGLPALFYIVCGILALAGLHRLLADLLSREELWIHGATVRYLYRIAGQPRDERSLDLAALSQISVKADPGVPNSRPVLWLVAGRTEIKFGRFAKTDELIALKDWLLARRSTGP